MVVLLFGMDTEHGGIKRLFYRWSRPVYFDVFVYIPNALAHGNDKNMNKKKLWEK